ncbi:hypothetical protein ABFA07_002660 [Porites harrisoni]
MPFKEMFLLGNTFLCSVATSITRTYNQSGVCGTRNTTKGKQIDGSKNATEDNGTKRCLFLTSKEALNIEGPDQGSQKIYPELGRN